jgi:hypothetical protein
MEAERKPGEGYEFLGGPVPEKQASLFVGRRTGNNRGRETEGARKVSLQA